MNGFAPAFFSVWLASAVIFAGHAHANGYWSDGQGQAIRSTDGECIKSGFWTELPRVPGCQAVPIVVVPAVAPPPVVKTVRPARIVLLPDPTGKVGAVVVRDGQTEVVLNQAFAGVQAALGAELVRSLETETSVRARYGDLLDAISPRPVTFVVRFETGSATRLTADANLVLAELQKVLSQWPAPQLMVVGHTDSVGSVAENDALSLRRAETVARFLSQRGILAQNIEIAGRGEREMLVVTKNGVADPRNRRVEITVR
jgi:outer membrane protein OmpA-like peptidoglycan-associated protein